MSLISPLKVPQQANLLAPVRRCYSDTGRGAFTGGGERDWDKQAYVWTPSASHYTSILVKSFGRRYIHSSRLVIREPAVDRVSCERK